MIQNVLMWLRQGLVMAQWAQFYQCRENRPVSPRGREKASRCAFKIAKLSFSTDLKHQPWWMNKGIWHFTHLAHIYLKCVELSVLNTVQHCNAGEDSDEWLKRGRVSSRPLWPQPESFPSKHGWILRWHVYRPPILMAIGSYWDHVNCSVGQELLLICTLAERHTESAPFWHHTHSIHSRIARISHWSNRSIIIHAISFIVLWLVRGRGKKAWRSCSFQLIWIEIE